MKSAKKGHTHIILIERGEKVIEKLTEYCREHKITAGFLTGIGAVDEAEIAHYIVDNKEYSSTTLSEPMEIANMSRTCTATSRWGKRTSPWQEGTSRKRGCMPSARSTSCR